MKRHDLIYIALLHKLKAEAFRLLLMCSLMLCLSTVKAVQMEASSAAIAANLGGTDDLTQVTFRSAFPVGTVPVVIVLPSDQGGQPCSIRIDNITNSGFRAACLETPNLDGVHAAMTVHYFAIEEGQHTLSTTSSGDIFILAGKHSTSTTIQSAPPFADAGSLNTVTYWNTGTGKLCFHVPRHQQVSGLS